MKFNINYYQEVRTISKKSPVNSAWPILISCCYAGRRMKMHIGIKVERHYWDNENQRLFSSHPDSLLLNSYLDKVNEVALRAFYALQKGGNLPGSNSLRDSIKGLLPLPTMGFFDAFIEFMEENHRRWTNNTYMKVRTLYKLLRNYDSNDGKKLYIHSFDNGDYHDIEMYFYNESCFQPITAHKYLNILKWFLNWAVTKKYYFNPSLREMKPQQNSNDLVSKNILYLTREELFNFYKLTGLTKREERVRDIFCFICFTGIRYSVLKNIRKPDVKNNYVYYQSFGKQVSVPLNHYALDILRRYDKLFFKGETLFPTFSLITVNKHLKLISVKAEITRIVYFHGEPWNHENGVCLSHAITIGVARNTFIMNGLLLGVSEETLARTVGGRSLFLLKRYKDQLAQKDKLEMSKYDDL